MNAEYFNLDGTVVMLDDPSLGVPSAQVGDGIRVKAVDSDGKPTEWEAYTPSSGSGVDEKARDAIGIAPMDFVLCNYYEQQMGPGGPFIYSFAYSGPRLIKYVKSDNSRIYIHPGHLHESDLDTDFGYYSDFRQIDDTPLNLHVYFMDGSECIIHTTFAEFFGASESGIGTYKLHTDDVFIPERFPALTETIGWDIRITIAAVNDTCTFVSFDGFADNDIRYLDLGLGRNWEKYLFPERYAKDDPSSITFANGEFRYHTQDGTNGWCMVTLHKGTTEDGYDDWRFKIFDSDATGTFNPDDVVIPRGSRVHGMVMFTKYIFD